MPFRMNSDEVDIVKDIPYHAEAGRRGLLDVYRRSGGHPVAAKLAYA